MIEAAKQLVASNDGGFKIIYLFLLHVKKYALFLIWIHFWYYFSTI